MLVQLNNQFLLLLLIANPITLFCPTNDAFDLLPSRVRDILEGKVPDNTTRIPTSFDRKY